MLLTHVQQSAFCWGTYHLSVCAAVVARICTEDSTNDRLLPRAYRHTHFHLRAGALPQRNDCFGQLRLACCCEELAEQPRRWTTV